MSDKTKRHLKQLGFSKSDMITISMIILRSSLKIVNAFVDYDRIITSTIGIEQLK